MDIYVVEVVKAPGQKGTLIYVFDNLLEAERFETKARNKSYQVFTWAM